MQDSEMKQFILLGDRKIECNKTVRIRPSHHVIGFEQICTKLDVSNIKQKTKNKNKNGYEDDKKLKV